MYLRTTSRRNKDGKTVRYLQLAHNERNAAGAPVAKVISSLGREDQIDPAGLEQLVGSIGRFLGAETALKATAPDGFRFLRAPESGGPHAPTAL